MTTRKGKISAKRARRRATFRALGSYLTQLREAAGLSQHRLAELAARTEHQFDRTYVAHHESGNFGSASVRFLNYLSLLGANAQVVLQILAAPEPQPLQLENRSCAELTARCRDLVAEAQYQAAVHVALASMRHFAAIRDLDNATKMRLVLGTVYQKQGNQMLARSHAEALYNDTSVAQRTRTGALLLLAQLAYHAHQDVSYHALLTHVDQSLFAAEDQLAAQFLITRAFEPLYDQRWADARPLLQRACEHLDRAGNPPDSAFVWANYALTAFHTARHHEANQALARARELCGRSEVGVNRRRFGISEARCLLAGGRINEARGIVAPLEQLFRDTPHTSPLQLARIVMLDVAIAQRDVAMVRSLARQVDQGIKSGALDRPDEARSRFALQRARTFRAELR